MNPELLMSPYYKIELQLQKQQIKLYFEQL